MTCSEADVSYLPLDMVGRVPTQVANVSECQALCASVEGCAHFAYWIPGRHCHIQDANSVRQPGELFVSGPPRCAPGRQAPPEVLRLLYSGSLSDGHGYSARKFMRKGPPVRASGQLASGLVGAAGFFCAALLLLYAGAAAGRARGWASASSVEAFSTGTYISFSPLNSG